MTLNGIVDNFYGLSWTSDPKDDDWRWDAFSHETTGVRIKVSLRGLIEQVFNTDDPFYMLHYFVAQIDYYKAAAIKQAVERAHYSAFLDSRGLVPALTLTNLRDDFKDEKEIRLLYSHKPANNNFVQKEIILDANRCRLKFDWSKVIQEVWLDHDLTPDKVKASATELNSRGISCRISQH